MQQTRLNKLIGNILGIIKRKLLNMSQTPVGLGNIPASMNKNFNYILKLNPRVTSFHEQVSLSVLSAVKNGNIIEIGCYLCYSTIMMASAFKNSNRKIYAVDMFHRERGWGNGGTDDHIFEKYSQMEFAKKAIYDCELSNSIVLKKGRSEDVVEELLNIPNVDMIFIDGDHSYEGCFNDLTCYHSILNSGGFLIAHDYVCMNWPGVKKAVDEFLLKFEHEYKPLYLINSMLVIQKE